MRLSEADPWTLVGSFTVDLPDTALAGIAATSHNEASEGAASFDNISITAAAPGPAPFLELHANPDGGVAAGWSGESGRRYQMMISTDLEGWAPHRLPMTGGAPAEEIDLSDVPAPFFLRLVKTEN
jgi:hypothetical protein